MSQHIFSVLVRNNYGVLTRVSSLFSRRGFNIESITAGVTENPAITRLTIAVDGDDYTVSQIEKQLSKLIDVIKIKQCHKEESVYRELMLIKVTADASARQEIIDAVNVFRANIVDMSAKHLVIEITGESAKIDAFTNLMKTYGIVELSRTGLTALERADQTIYN